MSENPEVQATAVIEPAAPMARLNGQIKLSTGVVLKATKIPTMILADIVGGAMRQKPKPPVVFIESKGRKEENPADPTYLADVSNWEAAYVTEINDAFIVFGTSILSTPKGFALPNDEIFMDKLSIMHSVDLTSKAKLYLAWVKYFAGPETEDVKLIVGEVGRLSGVSEEDVDKAVTQFQR